MAYDAFRYDTLHSSGPTPIVARAIREEVDGDGVPKPAENTEGLTGPEIDLLVSIVSERIIDCDKQGIPAGDSSSIFRETLLEKLVAMRDSAIR